MDSELSTSSLTRRQPHTLNRQPNAFMPPQPVHPLAASQLPTRSEPSLSKAPTALGTSIPLVGAGGTAYEAMCKKVLQRRLVRAFALTFAATLAITSCTLALNPPFRLLPSVGSSFTTLLSSLLIFVLGILPTLVLRKMLITQPESTTKSLWTRIESLLFNPSSHRTILVFTACALVQVFVWSLASELHNPEIKLGVFAPTTKHPFHLNERLVVVLLSSLSFGSTYALKELLSQSFLPRWSKTLRPLSELITNRLVSVPSLLSLVLPVIHTLVFSATYRLVRRTVWRTVLSWFGILTRPYIAYFVRSSWQPLTISLMLKMVLLHSMILLGWEIGKAIIEIYMVQPMLISEYSASPVRCLLAGLASSSPHIRHFAQTELTELATTTIQPSEFRKSLFTDLTPLPSSNPTSQGSTATSWQEVWRKEMVLLGQSYRTLDRRGATPAPTQSSSTGGDLTSSGAHGRPVASLNPKSDPSIFLNPRPVPLDAIAAPTAPPHASLQPAPQYRQAAPPPPEPSRVPKIFTSLSPSPQPPTPQQPAPAPSAVTTSSLTDKSKQLGLDGLSWTWSKLPGDVREVGERRFEWLRRIMWREQGRGWIRASLPHRREDVLVVKALCFLLTSSIREDPYGQIQRSIPQTLEALLSFHSALAVFQSQLRSLALSTSNEEEGKEEIERVLRDEGVEALAEEVREGIRAVVETFGESLSALKLPSWVARGLEGFVE